MDDEQIVECKMMALVMPKITARRMFNFVAAGWRSGPTRVVFVEGKVN